RRREMWKCRCKVPWLCSDDFLGGLRLWRAACGLCERARDRAAREIDLEGVVCVSFGVAQQHVRRAGERRGIGRLPAQSSFGLWIVPRPVRDTPERETSLLDDIAIELEPNRDRNEGETHTRAGREFSGTCSSWRSLSEEVPPQ